MNWALVIFAVVALAAAGGLWWWRLRIGGELALMAATPTSSAVDVAKLAPGTAVEVKGNLRCAAPLTAEFSKQACAHYKSEITREVVYYQRDSQGKREQKTRTESVYSDTRQGPCTVEDGSGKVALNLDGATIEGKEVVNRRQKEEQSVAATVINVALGNDETRTLIHTETILATDIPVYVLGEVGPNGSIGKPAQGSRNSTFIVSIKSEEERTKSLGSTMTWLLVFAILLAAAAAILAFFAIKSAV